jgi:metal-sulfur cluster biosynthetic enzyme
LKLIYDIKVDNCVAEIKMTLTTPACPVAQSFPEEVKNKVKEISGIKEANVELVWEPAWSPELLSEDIKLELGII